jgi:CYTH domain-containing protein
MVAKDEPAPQAGKYARSELERKFVLERVPDPLPAGSQLYDRYLVGTRLRLRRVERPDGRLEYKLNQKEASPRSPALMTITTLYLSRVEYDLLSDLPAHELRKRRHRTAGYSIDVFEGALAGLVLAEREYASEEELWRASAPQLAVRDVSSDVRYTGGWLAANGRPE